MVAITPEMCFAPGIGNNSAKGCKYDAWPVQLGFERDPWRTAVVSMLLNRTSHVQARHSMRLLMQRWPNAVTMAIADPWDVSECVRHCGFVERRTKAIVQFSKKWVRSAWQNLMELPGVGPYVNDAVGLFCFDLTDLASDDGVLVTYAAALRLLRDSMAKELETIT